MTDTRPCVLAFDVFGTVADWHGSIVRELARHAPAIDGAAFARDWRAGYRPAMDRVANGELPWQTIDKIHRRLLDALLVDYGLDGYDEAARAALNQVWHRLDAWPEAPAALTRLRRRYICVTLSNGNVSLLVDQARHAGLTWDSVLSAELFKRYKPDPATYLGVCALFDRPPAEVMMVATHQNDLEAAARQGLSTAYIERPTEYGADVEKSAPAPAMNTYHARDLADLADQLAA